MSPDISCNLISFSYKLSERSLLDTFKTLTEMPMQSPRQNSKMAAIRFIKHFLSHLYCWPATPPEVAGLQKIVIDSSPDTWSSVLLAAGCKMVAKPNSTELCYHALRRETFVSLWDTLQMFNVNYVTYTCV